MGDFNIILNDNEKQGGVKIPYFQMTLFRDFVSTMGLKDLSFCGPPMTWNNR